MTNFTDVDHMIKEFLNPDQVYKLVCCAIGETSIPENWIEIPEGATSYNQYTRGGSDNEFFIKLVGDTYCFANKDTSYMWEWYGGSLKGHEFVLWQRETLNDKVASAEVARQSGMFVGTPFSDLSAFNFGAIDDFVESNVEQGAKHSHYKKDISHLNTLDIYRVTELFNPHSCGAHIAKKALCSGQRGHKDLLTDIQDIIDTAERWKEMLIEDEKAK